METFAKRILTVMAAVLLVAYVGYHVFMASYSPVTLQSVEIYEEYETIETEGIVVRNETLYNTPDNGYVYYVAENGSRVAKGGLIADVYVDQQAAQTQQRLKEIDEEIASLKAIEEQGQNSWMNMNIISTQLNHIQSDMISEVISPSYTQIESLSAELLAIVNKQKMMIGQKIDFSARIAELTQEKNSLSTVDTTPISSIPSGEEAGYFVNSVDGYEMMFDTKSIETVTVESIRNALDTSPSVNRSAYIGKVVSGYEWYLACVVSSEELLRLKNNTELNIRMPFASNEIIPVTVIKENPDRNGETAVILRCDYMSPELADIRIEQVQLLIDHYEGLRVPDEAIQFNEKQEAGVYVQEGNILYFRRIQVLYHNDKELYSICEEFPEDAAYLQMYDNIVLEGKDLYDEKIVRGS